MTHALAEAFGVLACLVALVANLAVLWAAIADHAVLQFNGANCARGRIAVANIRRKLVRLALIVGDFNILIFAAIDLPVFIAALMACLMAYDAFADWQDRRFLVDFIRGKHDAEGRPIAHGRRESDREKAS